MKSYEFITNSPEKTFEFAKRIAALLQPKDVLLLEGDLGAGKTTFTKGLAKGLGIDKIVNSPTFTIIKEYAGWLPLYHMDVYRVQDEFEDLGFDEYFEGEGVTIVEWAHLIKEQLPKDFLSINIFHLESDKRRFEIKPNGKRYELLCKELFV